MGRRAGRRRVRPERSARRRAGHLRYAGQAAVPTIVRVRRRVREGSRAHRGHHQRAAQGLQYQHRRRLPGRHRHVSRRAQRLPVRDQSGRGEVGLADVERGPRPECELGRHLGCRHAHRRGRLVRRDRDSVQDAQVRSRGDAELGHQLPAPPAPQERKQLLVAAAPDSPVVARVDGRHLRGPAGPEARRQRPRQAVRARQHEQARRRVARQGLRRGLRRQVRRDLGTDVGLHRQHRLLPGRSRRTTGQPDTLQPVLPGET